MPRNLIEETSNQSLVKGDQRETSNRPITKLEAQANIFESPAFVLQANWELYTFDRGEIRIY